MLKNYRKPRIRVFTKFVGSYKPLLLLMLLFCKNISFARFANGQTLETIQVSLNVKNMPLKEVFTVIEQKTGLSIGYSASIINPQQQVSLQVNSQSVAAVLKQLLKSYNVTFQQVDDTHVFVKPAKKVVAEKKELVLASAAFLVVKGRVVDENNQPAAGVTVSEKGGTVSAVTDKDGYFVLNVKSGAVLLFSYVGYDAHEVVATGQDNLLVQLKVQSNVLQEYIAIGYQSIRKSDVTGAVASVKASEMNLTSPTVGQALAGKIAGVQVSQVSGAPYASTKIRVRGIGSFNASSDPLYVIDGYPTNNDIFINPNDIESIEVLKDAASAAIYGSRASGGVVLITTKRGKDGKGKLDYDLQTGINQLARKVKLLNGQQFAELLVDARNNSYYDLVVNKGLTWNDGMYSDNNATRVGLVGNSNQVSIPEFLYDFPNQKVINPTYNTDWQDLLYRNAVFTRHNLSFSGGNSNVKYFLSGGYQNQDGIVLNTGQKRINLRSNIDAQVTSKIKAGINISYTQSQNKELSEGRWDHNPIMTALLMPPVYRAFNDDGSYRKNEVAAGGSTYGYNTYENPMAMATEVNIKRRGNRGTYNAFASYQVLPELSFKVNLGVQTYSEKYDYYWPTSLSSGVNPPYSTNSKNDANAVAQTIAQTDQLAEFTGNYNKKWKGHKLDVLAGYTAQKTSSDLLKVTAKGFENDRIQEISNKGADAAYFTLNSAVKSAYTLVSYLSRVSYSYDNRYFFTASFRTDGSSRFGRLNRWGQFPSASAGWNLSDESFYHDWLGKHSTVKLRASWGLSGNNNIGNYSSQQVMATPTGTVFGNNTIATANYAGVIRDEKLGWESTSQYNAGLDISVFNNRLNIIANYYTSYSYNLLFDQSISAVSGSASILTNLRDSKIRNRGIDLQLDGRVIRTKNVTLNLNGNIAVNRNKVLNMGGNNTIMSAGAERSYKTHITKEGQPVGMFYGFQVLGVATAENYTKLAPSASSTNPLHPGDLYFKDVKPDGVINDDDKDIIGTPYPKFTYGFGITSSYKALTFSASFNGSYGNQVLDGQDYYLYNMEGSGNQYADVAERYRNAANPGNGKVYRASRAGTQSNSTRLSTFYLQDGSYFRCTNITLAYNLSLPFMQQKIGISNARIFAAVDNPFTITRYKGYNPEVDFNGGANLTPGVDYGMYPLVRAYNLGLKLTF